MGKHLEYTDQSAKALKFNLVEDLNEKDFQENDENGRERKEGETTPEYLNYINTVVNQAHQEIILLSPFYKISTADLIFCVA